MTKNSILNVQEGLRSILLEPIKKGKEVDVAKDEAVVACLKMVRFYN